MNFWEKPAPSLPRSTCRGLLCVHRATEGVLPHHLDVPLGISRVSFYRWANPTGLTPTAKRHSFLSTEVAQEFEDADHMAGRDQLTKLLNQRGITVAAGTMGSIMRESGLRTRRMRAWKKTTVVDPAAHTEHIKKHMLDEHGKRDFTCEIPRKRLVGDITYLKNGSGWLYLATVIDLATRMVAGWSMDLNMRTPLIINALGMARDHGRLHPDGAIFHWEVPKVMRRQQDYPVHGIDRYMLGRCCSREFLLAFEDRDVPVLGLPEPSVGTDGRDGIHRDLVQPAQAPQQQSRTVASQGLDRVSTAV